MNNDDRREYPRIPVAARVKLIREGKEVIWLTRNLSIGGLYLACETPPYVGDMMELELSLPSEQDLLRLKGEVVWRADGQGCGVRFNRVTAAQRASISRFLDTQPESESDS